MTKCAVLFDLDGTLIDSRLDLAAAVNFMRTGFQMEPLAAERVVKFVGNGIEMLVRRAVADSSVDVAEAIRRVRKFYGDHLVDTTALYPGVTAGLARLQAAGIPLGVITNKPECAATRILETLHVCRYFTKIIGGDGAFPLKPEPDALLHLADEFGTPPARTLMVGDHYTDLEAARRAGCPAIFAEWGFGEIREETPAMRAPDFDRMTELVLAFQEQP